MGNFPIDNTDRRRPKRIDGLTATGTLNNIRLFKTLHSAFSLSFVVESVNMFPVQFDNITLIVLEKRVAPPLKKNQYIKELCNFIPFSNEFINETMSHTDSL